MINSIYVFIAVSRGERIKSIPNNDWLICLTWICIYYPQSNQSTQFKGKGHYILTVNVKGIKVNVNIVQNDIMLYPKRVFMVNPMCLLNPDTLPYFPFGCIIYCQQYDIKQYRVKLEISIRIFQVIFFIKCT